MILGIDASNIRAGGGVTHLIELLSTVDPSQYDFSKVIVWSNRITLGKIENRPWLLKKTYPYLNKTLPWRMYWQRFHLPKLAKSTLCDILFVPGGTFLSNFNPFVTMSRNMLPFEWQEKRRFGLFLNLLRYFPLKATQLSTFRKASGLIFLSNYAKSIIKPILNNKKNRRPIKTIPFGINDGFQHEPSIQKRISEYSHQKPFRFLYISIINLYKHQWHVADAVYQLRQEGFPVSIDFVGPAFPPALKKLRQTQHRLDPDNQFIRYEGAIPYNELSKRYLDADAFIFASSCENMPNILLEAMASGLPIACSNRGPMPEVLGECGVYFNPENPDDIATALRTLLNSHQLRTTLAKASFERSTLFSWNRCVSETFEFLSFCAKRDH